MGAKVVGSVFACLRNGLGLIGDSKMEITPTVDFDYIEIMTPVFSATSSAAATIVPTVTVAKGGTGMVQMSGSSNNSSGLMYISVTCSSTSIKFEGVSDSCRSSFVCTIVYYKYNS